MPIRKTKTLMQTTLLHAVLVDVLRGTNGTARLASEVEVANLAASPATIVLAHDGKLWGRIDLTPTRTVIYDCKDNCEVQFGRATSPQGIAACVGEMMARPPTSHSARGRAR